MAAFPERFEQHIRMSGDPLKAVAEFAPVLYDVEAREVVLAAASAWNDFQSLGDLCPASKRREFLVAVFEHCTRNDFWHQTEIEHLLSLFHEPNLPDAVADFLFGFLDRLPAHDLSSVEGNLRRIANSPYKMDPRQRKQVASYLPKAQTIAEALAIVRPHCGWAIALHERAAELTIEPATAQAVLRLATAAARAPAREDEWLTDLSAIANEPGAVHFAKHLISVAMTTDGSHGLCGDDELIVCGAVLLVGAAARSGGAAPLHNTVAFLEEAARWGATWKDTAPECAPVARAALSALLLTASGEAAAAVDRLAANFGNRRGFKKAIADAQRDLRQIQPATPTAPNALGSSFDLDSSRCRVWRTPDGDIKVRVDSPSSVVIEAPEIGEPSDAHILSRAEAELTTANIQAELVAIQRRFEQQLRAAHRYKHSEFETLSRVHPLTATVAETLLWRLAGCGKTGFGVAWAAEQVEATGRWPGWWSWLVR